MNEESGDIKNVIVIGLIKGTGRRNGQFLFVKEPDGTILFPGGKVKVTEALTEALHREIKEETGFDCIGSRLVCIEYVGCWEKGMPQATRSILLYFFDVNISQKKPMLNEKVLWMGQKQIKAAKAVIPYDNLLMARGLAYIELGRPYSIPPGFQDTPVDPSRVAVRTFCWAAEKA